MKKILSSRLGPISSANCGETPRPKVLIAIPTKDSLSYLQTMLQGLYPEITATSKSYDITLLIYINGTKNGDEIEKTINAWHKVIDRSFSIKIIVDPEAGKNRAMNRCMKFGRTNNHEILHFFDDDITILPGSLKITLDTIAASDPDKAVLVGSQALGLRDSWRVTNRKIHQAGIDLEGQKILIATKIFQWVINGGIYTSPEYFQKQKYCDGKSLGARIAHLPAIPENGGEADDCYLNDWFYLNGQVVISDQSFVFARLVTSIKEERNRRIRIGVGIAATRQHFPDKEAALREYFGGSPINLSETDKQSRLFKFQNDYGRWVFRGCSKKIKAFIKAKQVPDWAAAKSTKPNQP